VTNGRSGVENTATNAPPARILVVEDEAIAATDIERSLAALGYSVVGRVSTGVDAVQQARACRPDLVLMDVHLRGELDEVAAATIIREELQTPVIFLSAFSDGETINRAMSTEPFAYILKPFKEIELGCAIEIALHRSRTDAVLRRRERIMATTLRSIGDAVVATNEEEKITLFNRAAEKLTGWTAQEALGRKLAEVMSFEREETGEAIEAPLREAMEGRGVAHLPDKVRLVGTHGPVTIDGAAAAIVDDDGSVFGGVVAVCDVTARTQAEKALGRLNDSLEQRVRERTAELTAANEELESFAYAVSHDLRAPLRAMSGFSQAIVDDYGATLPGEAHAYLDQIALASHHMGDLIDGLLTLSRCTRGDLQRDQIDLCALCDRVRQELMSAEPARRVTWHVEAGLTARGDGRMIQVVMRTLLGNAWKFTALTAVPEIRVYAERDSCENTLVCVTDNGAGFDMRHAAKLFKPFQRLHRQEEFPGTGIGLATAQRIVHRHGGTIHATAAVGQGATFRFSLPSAEEGGAGSHGPIMG
jgi:PAS domain S-box-containing protein